MVVVQCTLNSWKYCAMPKVPTSPKPSSMIKIRINRKQKYESIILGRRRCSQQRGVLWRARGKSWVHLWLQHYSSTSKEMHWQPSGNMWADLCQGYLSNITQGSLACSVRNLSHHSITNMVTGGCILNMEALPRYALLPNKVHIATSNQDTYKDTYKSHRNYLPFKSFGKKTEERKQNDVVNTAFVNSYFQILARIP